MGLRLSGELLAATSKKVNRKSDGKEIEIRRISVFDTDTSTVVEAGLTFDLPSSDWNMLRERAAQRPHVELVCILNSYGLQADAVAACDLAAPVPA